MKTKNLLFLILLLGLSFNTFSQEEVTIKQVIKNTATNAESFGDAIKVIKIWAKIPVTIKSGKENAIYLTGDMKENEKDKLSSFCVLKNNVFEISSPYLFLDEESKPKDFSKFRITLELADDVYTYYFRGNGNVTISKDIITEGAGTFNIWDNSQIIIEGEANFGLLNIFAQENSMIRFNSINANGAILNMEKGSIIDLNGKVKEIEVMNQGEGAKIIGDYNATSFMYHNLAIQDDDYFSKNFVGRPKHKRDPLKIDKEGNILNSKGDTISKSEDKDAEDSKFIKDTFAYSSLLEAIKTNEEDNISKSYDKENKKKKAGDISFQLGYGILGWSNRVSGIDDLFASPKGQYILRYSDSWSFGFRYDAKISKRWTISSGIGYESNIFRFENNVVLTTIDGDRRIDFETNNLIDAESKLVARYVTVPLFIKYRVVKNFTLHAGAIAGVNFRTSSTGFKRDYEQQNKEIEERWGTKYDNFKPLKLDVQAGFGWNDINFYVKYSLIPLFKNNKEVEVYPYSVGVSFGL